MADLFLSPVDESSCRAEHWRLSNLRFTYSSGSASARVVCAGFHQLSRWCASFRLDLCFCFPSRGWGAGSCSWLGRCALGLRDHTGSPARARSHIATSDHHGPLFDARAFCCEQRRAKRGLQSEPVAPRGVRHRVISSGRSAIVLALSASA